MKKHLRQSLYFLFLIGLNAHAQKDTVFIKESELKWINANRAGLHIVNTDTLVMLHGRPYFKYELSKTEYSAIIRYKRAMEKLLPIVLLKDNGQWLKVYHTNGEVKYGPYKEYYENGKLKVEGSYDWKDYRKKEGTWKYYSKEGKLKKEATYKNGKKISCKKY